MRTNLLIPLLLAACGSPEPVDRDGDGVAQGRDCDDQDADRFPGNADLVGDGVDNNCDGVDGVDGDLDGVAGAASGGLDCADDDPLWQGIDEDLDEVPACADCNDADPSVAPGMAELCDGIDQDCDGQADADPDGVGVCTLSFGAGAPVDALFVIDNSCSMSEEQELLATSAHALTDGWLNSGLDYQVGVISTDMADPSHSGKLRQSQGQRWVEATTPDRDLVLATMIEMGIGGSADERGLDASFEALDGAATAYNEGFGRPHAALELIVLSDEDDHSALSRSDFREWLLTHRSAPSRLHAIVSHDPPGLCGAETGLAYLDLAAETGGVSWDLCAGDYAGAMTAIAQAHDASGRDTFQLEREIDPATLAAELWDASGILVAGWTAAELTWDPVSRAVILPQGVPPGGTLTLWFAPGP